MTQASPTKASLLAVKREIARRVKRNKHEHLAEELNVVPMMDMMTIILVFLLKQMASSAGNIPQGAELRLPTSTVATNPSNALQVIVSRVSITVNQRFITSLRYGTVDPSQKRGENNNDYTIIPLADVMRDQFQNAQTNAQRSGQPFNGEVAIIADRTLPSRTVYEVLYTCGQHGFSNFQLLVLKGRSS